jgi:hypothetical protein
MFRILFSNMSMSRREDIISIGNCTHFFSICAPAFCHFRFPGLKELNHFVNVNVRGIVKLT